MIWVLNLLGTRQKKNSNLHRPRDKIETEMSHMYYTWKDNDPTTNFSLSQINNLADSGLWKQISVYIYVFLSSKCLVILLINKHRFTLSKTVSSSFHSSDEICNSFYKAVECEFYWKEVCCEQIPPLMHICWSDLK